MSIEATHLSRTISPARSGNSSPVTTRFRAPGDDGLNRKDKSYRRYASAVERALSLFDSALQVWADYIAFLGRLQKALQTRPPAVAEIPHKVLLSKRLAQCLNPTLPSGVHQKALELYTHIFSVLQRDGLGRDLQYYLPGLAPTLSFASLNVRPLLLSLFDGFIVGLEPSTLRPALKAIILALLPGLEEDTSEEFERVHRILNNFQEAISKPQPHDPQTLGNPGAQYFWQCFFLASITSPTRRQGALAYLERNLPQLGGHTSTEIDKDKKEANGHILSAPHHLAPEAEAIVNPEPGLLVRCFTAGLRDEQILVQRGFLNLLVTHLPLQAPVLLQKVVPEDLERLIAAAVSVVARREMSLNKRLWAWFLGPESLMESDDTDEQHLSTMKDKETLRSVRDSSVDRIQYFKRLGLEPLVANIQKMLTSRSILSSDIARPFRICLSLMDRPEIGRLVVPRIFGPALECLWHYQKIDPPKDALTSASAFFDGVESGLIWGQMIGLMTEALDCSTTDPKSARERLEIISYTVAQFVVRENDKGRGKGSVQIPLDEETISIHMPLAMMLLMARIRDQIQALLAGDSMLTDLLGVGVELIMQLLDQIPERVLTERSLNGPGKGARKRATQQEGQAIAHFYENLQQGSEAAPPPFAREEIRQLLLQTAIHLVMHELRTSRHTKIFDIELLLLEKVMAKVSHTELLELEDLLSGLLEAITFHASQLEETSDFSVVEANVSVLEKILFALPQDQGTEHKLRGLVPRLIDVTWPFLSPSKPTHNVEAVRYIRRIHAIANDPRLVESSITALMMSSPDGDQSSGIDSESVRRFVTLWTHSVSPSTRQHARLTRVDRSQPFDGIRQQMQTIARPLLLVLDTLAEKEHEVSLITTTWLQSLPNVKLVLDLLMANIQAFSFETTAMKSPSADKDGGEIAALGKVDVDECLYYLQTISNVLQFSAQDIWSSVTAKASDGREDDDTSQVQGSKASAGGHGQASIQASLTHTCLAILDKAFEEQNGISPSILLLRQRAVSLLRQMILGLSSAFVIDKIFEEAIIAALAEATRQADLLLQRSLMDLLAITLRNRSADREVVSVPLHRRIMSSETIRSIPRVSLSGDTPDKEAPQPQLPTPPPALLECLVLGIRSCNTNSMTEIWVGFLVECLPYYSAHAFQVLMPFVDCLTKSILLNFELIKGHFENGLEASVVALEPTSTLLSLMHGVEQVLARAHDKLVQTEGSAPPPKPIEQPQGFFGNMVSGVFAPEAQKQRNSSANNRLTVLLCLKDTVGLCLQIWSWGDSGRGSRERDVRASASFNHTSIRVRNRTRRVLEHLFAAETLECVETLVEAWCRSEGEDSVTLPSTIINLIHALEHSRPRNAIPALFNALYSRTNPGALDPVRKSTLTADLSDLDLAGFLVAYTRSLDADALDEIWIDCMTFLRDVLANPLPHRQILPRLLEFTAILGEKVDNTNFGDQRKMRRELSELFIRVLAAIFTTKPLGFPLDTSPSANATRASHESLPSLDLRKPLIIEDVVTILAKIMPNISAILVDKDRIASAASTVSLQILAPTFRWKSFPQNVTSSTLEILIVLSRLPEASKHWRKEMAEAFNDSRFFCRKSLELSKTGWIPVLQQWVIQDKDRLAEYLSRLSSPTSAGIMFGVGASSARLEADRKTQLNLRRLALLVLAAPTDAFVPSLSNVHEKVSELVTATAASSPSSITRAEVYMLLRAVILKTSPVHLAAFWPIINTDLSDAISSMFPGRNHDTYNVYCVVQACKLLDTLLVLAPDDFQMGEWLFVTDTIDAVYRPSYWEPTALVDELADDLDAKGGTSHPAPTPTSSSLHGGKGKPLLTASAIEGVPKSDLVDRVLRPFFRQLSISVFESTYSMEQPDWDACYDDLLYDIFDDSTLV